jgi:hypothetical protein
MPSGASCEHDRPGVPRFKPDYTIMQRWSEISFPDLCDAE